MLRLRDRGMGLGAFDRARSGQSTDAGDGSWGHTNQCQGR